MQGGQPFVGSPPRTDAGPGGGGAWDLEQTRAQNDANEISGITENPGDEWDEPTYSARGNMITVPKPTALTATYACKYDAWNRLVEVKLGETVVAKRVGHSCEREQLCNIVRG